MSDYALKLKIKLRNIQNFGFGLKGDDQQEIVELLEKVLVHEPDSFVINNLEAFNQGWQKTLNEKIEQDANSIDQTLEDYKSLLMTYPTAVSSNDDEDIMRKFDELKKQQSILKTEMEQFMLGFGEKVSAEKQVNGLKNVFHQDKQFFAIKAELITMLEEKVDVL